jgi:predicted Zn-dependent protease
MGMSTFLAGFAMSSRLALGYTRNPTFFDTHPLGGAGCAVRARDPLAAIRRSVIRAALLRRIAGLEVGPRPAAGSSGSFQHPALGFTVRFPPVGAVEHQSRSAQCSRAERRSCFSSPTRRRVKSGRWRNGWNSSRHPRGRGFAPVKVAGIDAWRVEAYAEGRSGSVRAQLTFIPFHDATWRITGAAPAQLANRHEAAMLATARSFRPLTAEERSGIEVTRLQVETARAGEGIAELSKRSHNVWSVNDTAVYNGVFADRRFAGGELVKIAVREAYAPTAH